MLFFCLIVICLYLNEFTLAFTPKNTVSGPSAVFANSRIYFTGGFFPQDKTTFNGPLSKEFYYLDVEQPFRVGAGDKLNWVDLSYESQILPEHVWSAFSNCGLDNSLFLYTYTPGEPNPNPGTVYNYIGLQQWNNKLTTNPPPHTFHSQTQTVCDVRTGKMYRFGGLNTDFDPGLINDSMDILDISTLMWTNSSTGYGRYDHTGTLLPNGNIVYIGGKRLDGGYVEMSELLLYNTNNNTWTFMNTAGKSPTPRAYHSAVLTQDGRIIVYGGNTGDSPNAVTDDDLVILDTSQPNYTWSQANAKDPPPSRYYHTATLVGYYMIVAFGRTNNDLPSPTSNEVFILDTYDKSNYKWVNEFDPNPNLYTNPNTNPNKNPSTQNRSLTIGIIILSSVLALIGASFLVYFYRKRRLSKPDLLVSSSQEANKANV